MSNIKKYDKTIFENIKNVNEYGAEFWYARDLQKALGYSDFRNFKKVIEKAKKSCKNSNKNVLDHIVEATEMVSIGSGTKRKMPSFILSRYACYLIVQNADPRKEIIALGQTYFALQTRKQEIQEDKFEDLSEEEKRLAIRNELKKHNKNLADAANNAGVKTHLDYAIFQNHGYKGLYGGLKAKDIHKKKKLKKNHKILDFMGSTELAANLFRATQTEDKLRRDKIKGKKNANETHHKVGKKVRDTIKDLGGTMPENLPTPKKSVKKIETEQKKLINKKNDNKS